MYYISLTKFENCLLSHALTKLLDRSSENNEIAVCGQITLSSSPVHQSMQ